MSKRLIMDKKLVETYNILWKEQKLNIIRDYRLVLLKIIQKEKSNSLKKSALMFYVNNHLNHPFTKELIKSICYKKKVVYPLPNDLIFSIKKEGININVLKSKLQFKKLLIKSFFKGLLFLGKNICQKTENFQKNSILFLNLSEKNLPFSKGSFETSIFSIISKKAKFKNKILYHNVTTKNKVFGVKYLNSFIPKTNFLNKIKCLTKSISDILMSVIYFLNGEWWEIILTQEKITNNFFRYADKKNLANIYVLPDSNSIYKPLWIEEVEKRKIEVILYDYSMSNEPEPIKGVKSDINFISVRDWKVKLFLNKFSKNQYLKGNDKIITSYISGNYDFETFNEVDFPLNKNYIIIYNLRIPTNYFGFSYLNDYKVFDVNNSKLFLDNIIEANNSKYKLYLKQKRLFNSNNYSQELENYIKKLVKQKKIEEFNPSLSNIKVSKSAKGIISYPFTSTAHLAKKKNASIYYDPTGKINTNDPARHGFELINNKLNLKRWIINLDNK